MSAASGIETPMPILAPVERPLEDSCAGCGGGVCVEPVGVEVLLPVVEGAPPLPVWGVDGEESLVMASSMEMSELWYMTKMPAAWA